MSSRIEKKMDQASFSQIADVFYFQWHITDKCNLHCTHCYQENYTGATDVPLEELKVIANKLLQTLSKWKKKGDVTITGGEPFAKIDLFPFIEYLESFEEVAELNILSNGTLITDGTAEELKKFTKLRSVQVSLDGSSSKTHDNIRGAGTFEKAIKGIRTLVSHKIDVNVMFTLQRCNVNDVPPLIDLAIEEKISGLAIERLVPMGNSKNVKDSLLSSEELRDVFQYISERADLEYKRGMPLFIYKHRPLWINIDSCRAKIGANLDLYRTLGASCSIGLDGICILPEAIVLACRRLPISIGNLRKDSLEKIWFTSELLWQIRDKKNLKGKCNSCEFIPRCGGCRAMAYACTGDYLAEDPQCWK